MSPEVPASRSGGGRTPLRRVEGQAPVPAREPRIGREKGEAPSARGERTRGRIVDAVLDLLDERELAPTAKEVATRAGVSVRLVFHHFEDMDALYRACAAVQLDRHWRPLGSVPSDLALSQRIDRTAAQRAKLFDAISGVRRTATSLSMRHDDVAKALSTSNTLLRTWLEETFSSELEASGGARGDLLAAIEVAASWEAWERLRRGQGLSKAAARRVLVRTLHALLAA